MKKMILLVASALLLAACKTETKCPVLSVEGGQVQGVTTDIPGVLAFKGIPYAAPPIGELRWKEPQPVVPWDGVMVADRFGHPGYQAVHYPGGYFTEWGYGEEAQCSEDCLYLNVWTPAAGKVGEKLPVAYWIHGGGYREGWGSEPEFDGEEFARHGIVLVSINYRLGVFGFLAHPELAAESPHGVSGNYGVLDMIQGLKWVRENIAQFGGDPDNVMIFGQSAGGGAVRTLVESPLARGLFHKAVIMSAGGMGGMGGGRMAFAPQTLEEIQNANKKILDWAGLTDLQKMRAAGTETIYALSTIYAGANGEAGQAGGFGRGPALTGAPIVDGYVSLKSFDEAAKDGSLADVPYMIGFTKDDMGNMTEGIANFALNREEKGGTYGVGVEFDLDKDDSPNAVLRISYNADPERYDELNPIVYKQLQTIADKGPEATSMSKVKEYLLKQYDQMAITNDYWDYVAWHELDDEADFDAGYCDLVRAVTPQDVQQMARLLVSRGRCIEVTMLSE